MYSEHEDSETKIVILRTRYAKPGKTIMLGMVEGKRKRWMDQMKDSSGLSPTELREVEYDRGV